MTFKLKVGDVCNLKEMLPGTYRKNDWKTGLYRVTQIFAPFCYGKDKEDPRRQSYFFEKIKKDGTAYKGFSSGYNCMEWDKFIDEGRVEIV
jgi:hypothetical protein